MTPGFQPPVPSTRRLSWVTEREVLEDNLVYVCKAGFTYTVPKGFVTDYASIPQIFWNIPGFDPEGPAAIPAVLHDYLYSLRGSDPYFQPRAACDAIFLEAMESVGVPWLTRHLIYRAVRIFGGLYSMSAPWREDVFSK